MKNESLLQVAIGAATAAGKILLDNYNEDLKASKKESLRDVATEVDKLAENEIIRILTEFDSNISIYTEEQGKVVSKSTDSYWLIDALDGTVNYLNHIPFFCVSIAYIEKDVTQVGAIYVPLFDDIYFGARGHGVFKNHEAIRAKNSPLSESLFAVSFSGKNYDPANRQKEFDLFASINDTSRGCLRTGSAALNLALLAEGRLDGCWGKANKHWDIASGILLAELAGHKISAKAVGQGSNAYSYLACDSNLWNELYPRVREVLDLD